MWNWLKIHFIAPLIDLLGGGLIFLLTNLFIVLGLVCAVLIFRRISEERRSPSQSLSWLLLVLFLPFIGVPLYLIFGGRKSRQMASLKSEISRHANSLSDRAAPDEFNSQAYERAHKDRHTSKGNHFELLADGEATYKRLLHEIDQAEHTIHIATYILGKDETGQSIIEHLAKRAAKGVKVRLLLDSLGSWNKTRLARHTLRQAGAEVAMFIPVLPLQPQVSSNLRNHRKIALFDNFRAITGGQNLDNRFMGATPDPARFRDFSVVTQGPAVAEMTRIFIADWTFAAKQSPTEFKDLLQYIPEEAGNSTVEVIASGPDVPKDPLWEQVMQIVQEFRHHLTIVTPYFIPDEVLFQSLIVKSNTGRRIKLIIPLHSNQRITDIARFRPLTKLHDAGVEILFYTPGMLHAKLILADDLVALTGSANIDVRSLFVNFEIALAHYTDANIQELADWVREVEKDCISYDQAMKDETFKPSNLSQDLVQFLKPIL